MAVVLYCGLELGDVCGGDGVGGEVVELFPSAGEELPTERDEAEEALSVMSGSEDGLGSFGGIGLDFFGEEEDLVEEFGGLEFFGDGLFKAIRLVEEGEHFVELVETAETVITHPEPSGVSVLEVAELSEGWDGAAEPDGIFCEKAELTEEGDGIGGHAEMMGADVVEGIGFGEGGVLLPGEEDAEVEVGPEFVLEVRAEPAAATGPGP